MHTTITVKTEKKLHRDAKKTARKLGIPLTTIINAKLREFVREQSITVSARPALRPEKIAEWRRISDDMDKHLEKYPSYTMDEFLAHIEENWARADRKRRQKASSA